MDSVPAGRVHSGYVDAMFRSLGIAAATVALAAVLAAVLTTCTGTGTEPPPTNSTIAATGSSPSPTASTTGTPAPGTGAADAYLAYIDAANRFDAANPASLDDILARSTEAQHDADNALYEQLASKGWTIDGAYAVTLIDLDTADAKSAALNVCLDVSSLRFIDKSGAERVPPGDQDQIQSISVRMARTDSSPNVWLVAETARRDGDPPCG